MSLDMTLGEKPNIFDSPEQNTNARLELKQPILTNKEISKIKNIENNTKGKLKASVIDILFKNSTKEIELRDLNILGSKEEFEKIVNVKVRSTGRLLKAKIKFVENFAKVEILDKETGISPGQACVFYSKDEIGDKVLGGGWINKTFNNN